MPDLTSPFWADDEAVFAGRYQLTHSKPSGQLFGRLFQCLPLIASRHAQQPVGTSLWVIHSFLQVGSSFLGAFTLQRSCKTVLSMKIHFELIIAPVIFI